jgi:uncharacterized protein YggU (UPF0235/DUF167 family)
VTATIWRIASGGVEIRLRVTPRSRHDEARGLHVAPDGTMSLVVKVRALPDKGAANAAVIETLARALEVSKSRISLVSGSTGRSKTVLVAASGKEVTEIINGPLRRIEMERQ